MIPFVELNFKTNSIDKGIEMAKKIIKNFDNRIDNLNGLVLGKYSNDWEKYFEELTEILSKYDQKELIKELGLNKYVIKKTKLD
ncbi:MAG: hypothetical protein IH948_07440 [Bacteroidetes bacterium]|nr:hypothetical protein [Bacteroidota bacterium]